MKTPLILLCLAILSCGCGGTGEPTLEILGAEVRVHQLSETNQALVCDLKCRYSTGEGAILITPSGHAPEELPDVTYFVKGDKSIQRLWIQLAGTETGLKQTPALTAAQQSATVTTGREFKFGDTREHVLLSYKDLGGRQVTYALVYDPSRDWPRTMGIR